VTIQLLT